MLSDYNAWFKSLSCDAQTSGLVNQWHSADYEVVVAWSRRDLASFHARFWEPASLGLRCSCFIQIGPTGVLNLRQKNSANQILT
jgi:hypothetical protein